MTKHKNKESDHEENSNQAEKDTTCSAEQSADEENNSSAEAQNKEPNTDADVDANAELKDANSDDADAETELAAAHAEIAKLKDAFLRAKAEEDNIRRRSEKEVANSRKFAVEGFSKELLNVYDSLKLACAVDLPDDADDSIKSIHEGVQITLKQLDTAFSRFAVKEILPDTGDKLDPNLHQAMSMVESDEVESGCILNVIQSGFELHERLLRPAMVVVAK